ncbi:VOC family protein [Streptomyces sp. NPDC021020]|uniref:VOC family protein n=1 Tax=Streptomyces sp. NPDC021020 TaxID=3365109 RepID=UPI00379109CE
MRSDIRGIHHIGIVTRDLERLEEVYTALGFTLSPRSRHMLAPRPGADPVPGCTANRCALFGDSSIELLGIVDEDAPDPWRTKAIADEYEGFRLLNLETGDAEATDRRLTSAGLRTSGVLALEREVHTPQGTRTVRARAAHLAPGTTPEGYIGVAQHLTREHVHQTRYLTHRNTVSGIASILIVVADAEFDAVCDRYTRILGTGATQEGPIGVLDAGTARLHVVRVSDVDAVLPGETRPAPSYFAAVTVSVSDLVAARTAAEAAGVETRSIPGGGFFVSARDACTGLFFTSP